MLKRCTYEKTKEILFKENELSYYLLGAFITDGNITQDKSRTNSFKISLASKDKDWLDLIQTSLGGEGCLRQDKPITKNSHSLWIYSKEVFDWLNIHNCTPNKSLTVQLPNIPEQYFKDFLRGCIDGDGCISRGSYRSSKNNQLYEQITVYLCSASLQFIQSISKKLNELGFFHSFIKVKMKNCKLNGRIIYSKNQIYRLQICGYKKCIRFLDWLYDTSSISMPRKILLAKSIISHYKNGGTSKIGGRN